MKFQDPAEEFTSLHYTKPDSDCLREDTALYSVLPCCVGNTHESWTKKNTAGCELTWANSNVWLGKAKKPHHLYVYTCGKVKTTS